MTEVPAGHVGVVKSNVSERGRACAEERAAPAAEALTVALVPNGCRGVLTADQRGEIQQAATTRAVPTAATRR